MAEENKIRDAADAVKGIAEAVPVYQDVVQPAAKEVGKALQTVAKTLHVVLAPLQSLVWGYEKITGYLDSALSEKLKDVPQERIATPNPIVAVPVLQSLLYTAQEPHLRELFTNLLATSIDSKTAHTAHPAFVEIIKQLSPDEAKIMNYLASNQCTIRGYPIPQGFAMASLTLIKDGPMNEDPSVYAKGVIRVKHHSNITHKAGCIYGDLFGTYLDNLRRLQLVDIYNRSDEPEYDNEELYKPLRSELPQIEEITKGLFDNVLYRESYVAMTSFGQLFIQACISPKDVKVTELSVSDDG